MTQNVALPPKETGIAIGLTLLGFVLVAGMQHFYMGKIGRGILWFLTGGLFFVGTIVDLFTMSQQVKNVNARRAVGIS
ncbi:NINE protein [Leucobacter luti]|nr:NINE protein [Leucobacter luti]